MSLLTRTDVMLCNKLDVFITRAKHQGLPVSQAFISCAEWMQDKPMDQLRVCYPIFCMRVEDYMAAHRILEQRTRDGEFISDDERHLRKVTITWQGGWDRYLLDVVQIREITGKEQKLLNSVGNNTGTYPTIGHWLKGKFLQSPYGQAIVRIDRDQCVLIKEHLGGG